MHIEQETIDFVATIIGEVDSAAPLKIRQKIARKAITEDKISDSEWLKKELLEEESDQVFRQFKLTRHKKPFAEAYGEDAFLFMKKHLKDPLRISPRWACHFMSTVKAIGMETVVAQKDIHGFVTRHAEWVKNKKARKFFSPKNNSARRKQAKLEASAEAAAPQTALRAEH